LRERRKGTPPSHARPFSTTFLDTSYQQFQLSVDSYDPTLHNEFRDLIERRLQIQIQYGSIYGGERFTAVYPWDR
jgi:hypothetical protein